MPLVVETWSRKSCNSDRDRFFNRFSEQVLGDQRLFHRFLLCNLLFHYLNGYFGGLLVINSACLFLQTLPDGLL